MVTAKSLFAPRKVLLAERTTTPRRFNTLAQANQYRDVPATLSLIGVAVDPEQHGVRNLDSDQKQRRHHND